MTLHDRYGLPHVINAAGSFTPLGYRGHPPASGKRRAKPSVCSSSWMNADTLSGDIALQWSGGRAAVHCVAAGISLSVAAVMAGLDQARIAALPNTDGLPSRVVIPGGHAVNYGHPIEQDIRLAGATPIFAGSTDQCSMEDIRLALGHTDTACLLLVSSLSRPCQPIDLRQAVAQAHLVGVPAIIDGAAQDMRIGSLPRPEPISCWSALTNIWPRRLPVS
jgi:seryl-tRNA(Sec) selenium transferase